MLWQKQTVTRSKEDGVMVRCASLLSGFRNPPGMPVVKSSYAGKKKRCTTSTDTAVANPPWLERRSTLNGYKQLSHTTYLCNYHVVLCPKYRFRILYGPAGRWVRDWIRSNSAWRGVEIIEGHVSRDHVHLVRERLLLTKRKQNHT